MTLYITDNCGTCLQIRESLDDVAIAHETIVLPRQEWAGQVPEGTEPPVLIDDDDVVQGSRSIFACIDELRHLRSDWLKYQSDVCYCD